MKKLAFIRRPMPIVADHRPIYKISILLEILLKASRGNKSSLVRLQLINWCSKDKTLQTKLIKALDGDPSILRVWGIDPAVNIALNFSTAEGLTELNGKCYSLTTKGHNFANVVGKTEITPFLDIVGKRVSEKLVDEWSKEWI